MHATTDEPDTAQEAAATPAPDPHTLTPQEERLVACAAKGEWWEPLPEDGKAPDMDPANGDSWDKSRTIRADVIRCLAAGENWPGHAAWIISAKGLRIRGARIVGPFDLQGTIVSRTLWFQRCAFDERIDFSDSEMRTVSLAGTLLRNGLTADRTSIKGSLQLRSGFCAAGGVFLRGAKIDGQLSCFKGTFENAKGVALTCASITVDANVLLNNGFRSIGGVDLSGAKIKGLLSCSDGVFENEKGAALDANAMTVGTDVLLTGEFRAKGGVNLRGAQIGGLLDCSNGTFENVNNSALHCYMINVGSDVFLRNGFNANGKVNLYRARIAGNLRCEEGTFHNTNGDALVLTLAEIGAGLFLRKLKFVEDDKRGFFGQLVLSQTTCKVYSDDSSSWPKKGALMLDGFTYERFHECATDWKTRKEWLELQNSSCLTDSFRPQPWTQAVKVLREMGHDSDARELAFVREIARAKSRRAQIHLRAWSWLLQYTIGFGYKPHRALFWSLGLILFGWFVFATAANLGFMAPRDGSVQAYLAGAPGHPLPQSYARFNAAIFALDNFLPIIELGQDSAWVPSDTQIGRERARNDPWPIEAVRLALGHGWTVTGPEIAHASDPRRSLFNTVAATEAWALNHGFHRFVYWFNELAGWLLVSLFLAGMSGIMKRE